MGRHQANLLHCQITTTRICLNLQESLNSLHLSIFDVQNECCITYAMMITTQLVSRFMIPKGIRVLEYSYKVSNQVLLCLTAKTGEGLQEGMEWVVKQVKKK